MTENWLVPDKLLSLDEKVRVEIGPQVIELDCSDANLSDTITAPHYKVGGRDANGRVIRPDDVAGKNKATVLRAVAADKSRGIEPINNGEKMSCVDWKAKHAPHVWKIYQWQKTAETVYDEENQALVPVCRFVQVAQITGKDEAIAEAKRLYGEMS